MRILMCRLADISPQAQASLRCAAAALAAERFRLKHGFWPSGLSELVKEDFLKDMTRDPQNGERLKWKRTPTGIMIYGLGADKIDYGGKLDHSGTAWARGVDMGFELWDRRLRQAPAPVIEATK